MASTLVHMNPSVPGTAVESACLEKARLKAAYNSAAENLSRAVAVMQRYLGTMRHEEYENLKKYSERMRRESERALAALERHIAEHGC